MGGVQILEYRIGAVGNGAVPPARFPGTINDATMAALPSHRATVPAIDFDEYKKYKYKYKIYL
jgi:hypothetical protein